MTHKLPTEMMSDRRRNAIVPAEPVIVPPPEEAEPPPFVFRQSPQSPLDRRLQELEDVTAYLLGPVDEPAPEPEAPIFPAPDALMSDYGPVGTDDITGDLLLDAFEENEAGTAAVIQVLSATRQRHLSEQLNVEKARLRREHMLTDQANPREASIDKLLGLLTRRGD